MSYWWSEKDCQTVTEWKIWEQLIERTTQPKYESDAVSTFNFNHSRWQPSSSSSPFNSGINELLVV
jgi:hypothetical protein